MEQETGEASPLKASQELGREGTGRDVHGSVCAWLGGHPSVPMHVTRRKHTPWPGGPGAAPVPALERGNSHAGTRRW